jgi:hypothetical protein
MAKKKNKAGLKAYSATCCGLEVVAYAACKDHVRAMVCGKAEGGLGGGPSPEEVEVSRFREMDGLADVQRVLSWDNDEDRRVYWEAGLHPRGAKFPDYDCVECGRFEFEGIHESHIGPDGLCLKCYTESLWLAPDMRPFMEELLDSMVGILGPSEDRSAPEWHAYLDGLGRRAKALSYRQHGKCTKRDIAYKATPYGFICEIPMGTQVIPASNLPREGGDRWWAESWKGMSTMAESWMRNYGFLVDDEDVE